MGKDETTPAGPAIDYAKLGAAVATALQPILTTANQPLVDRLEKLQAPAPATQGAAADADKPKPVTSEDVGKIVADQLKNFQQTTTQTQQRQNYQGDKLKDLPPVYREKLGNDPTKWASEEKAIRDEFKRDATALGLKIPEIDGNAGNGGAGTAKAADVIDTSKLTAYQKMEMGLKTSKPQMNAAAGATAAATAAAAANPQGAAATANA